MTVVSGRVWKYGDDVNTDLLFPGRYLHILDPQEMARHALEDLDPEFTSRARPGDVVVGGRNWGCGSSREQGASVMKYFGIGAVVAWSFARIFYRNAINLGLPLVVCPDTDKIGSGHEVEVHLEEGRVVNRTTGETYRAERLPDFLVEIINDGGLIPNLKKRLGTL